MGNDAKTSQESGQTYEYLTRSRTFQHGLKVLAIIPARYGSTRLPGKPLIDIFGQTLIERVYRRLMAFQKFKFDAIIVATDDQRILKEVTRFGGTAILTNTEHQSGTDRCAEVLDKLDQEYDLVFNVQGDDPEVQEAEMVALIEKFADPNCTIATPALESDNEYYWNTPGRVKIAVAQDGRALYFSRAAIPFVRTAEPSNTKLLHLGVYAFRPATLREITKLPPSPLEKIEALEQLRWLEYGYNIQVAIVQETSLWMIDTAEDLAAYRSHLSKRLK